MFCCFFYRAELYLDPSLGKLWLVPKSGQLLISCFIIAPSIDKGRKEKANYQQLKKVLIVRQILVISIITPPASSSFCYLRAEMHGKLMCMKIKYSIGNMWETVRRIYMLIYRFKGLRVWLILSSIS